jgi:hypothetical protein
MEPKFLYVHQRPPLVPILSDIKKTQWNGYKLETKDEKWDTNRCDKKTILVEIMATTPVLYCLQVSRHSENHSSIWNVLNMEGIVPESREKARKYIIVLQCN